MVKFKGGKKKENIETILPPIDLSQLDATYKDCHNCLFLTCPVKAKPHEEGLCRLPNAETLNKMATGKIINNEESINEIFTAFGYIFQFHSIRNRTISGSLKMQKETTQMYKDKLELLLSGQDVSDKAKFGEMADGLLKYASTEMDGSGRILEKAKRQRILKEYVTGNLFSIIEDDPEKNKVPLTAEEKKEIRRNKKKAKAEPKPKSKPKTKQNKKKKVKAEEDKDV